MERILVTGFSGFVGTEVVRQLLTLGKKVTGLSEKLEKNDIPYIKADLRNYDELMKSLDKESFDVIIHLASLPGDTGNPIEMVNMNVNGTQNILEFARKSKIKKFVLASSISAYEWYPATKFNPPDYMPVDEKHPCRPKDMYSTTKLIQELLSMTYYHQYEVPVTVLRLSAVVGSGGKGGGRSWRVFAEELAEGKKIQIPHFSKEELCHYVDIRDVARMFIAVAEHPKSIGEIFNCIGPAPIRGFEFENIVKRLVPEIKVEYGYPWSMAQGGEIKFDMSKAQKLINFKPIYTVADSIMSIKEWVDSGGLSKEEYQSEKVDGNLKNKTGITKNRSKNG